MQQWQGDELPNLFTRSAMTSLRDVDVQVELTGGNYAEQIISRLQA
jgi:hypothetical protein